MIDRTMFAAGPHTRELFADISETLDAIEALPFLEQLATGELEELPFVNYLLQDELYLDGYARAMSLLAASAPDRDSTKFWALAAGEAVAVENDMHEAMLSDETFAASRAQLTDDGEIVASPTTLGYTSYLVATCATAPYAVGAAAVLPCFWIYAHVGKVLTERAAGSLENNPYRTWVETYDSPEFDESVRGAVRIVEDLFDTVPAREAAQMHAAFARASAYELRFWLTAHALEDWSQPA